VLIGTLATGLMPVNVAAQDTATSTTLLKNSTWEQLVLPGNPDGATVGSLFGESFNIGDYGQTWQLYTYDGVAMRYQDPGINGTISQSQAFWILQQTGVDVEFVLPSSIADASLQKNKNCLSDTGCAELPLSTVPGKSTWTMSGIPFSKSVPTQSISVISSTAASNCMQGCTLDEANNAGYVGPNVWAYDSATNNYVEQKSLVGIEPFQGFWVSTLPAADEVNPVILVPNPESATQDPSINKLPGVPQVYTYEGNDVLVSSASELRSAISNAKPGDVISVSKGLYLMNHKISINAQGSASNPIVLRAANTRETQINFSQETGFVEGFTVFAQHWVIDGFVLSSDCTPAQHSRCEHGIHVKSGANGLIVRNNKIIDFNAAIKGSGSNNAYADDVRIEHNEIFNSSVRSTSNPVTPIDINGGDSWKITKNSIYDFVKGQGNQVSYGAFLKGNSSNGVMDSNRVQCQRNVIADGARIGLSFGGGGNSPINSPICTNSDCSRLHRNGRMMNNVITNCSDVGIYINASSDTLIDHNTLFSTAGIDVRFDTSTARIVANSIVNGDISERQGGQVTQDEGNDFRNTTEITSFPELLNTISPHSVIDPPLSYDICGDQRTSKLIGAIGGTADERRQCIAGLQ